MTAEQLGDLEAVKTQQTGILHAFNAESREWCVLIDGGERLIFTTDMCQSTNGDTGETVFDSLLKGDKVSYTRGEGAEYDTAKNVGLVAHMDTKTLTAQVRETFDGAMEVMGPQMNGTIKIMKLTGNIGFGFITPSEESKDFFFFSDFGGHSRTINTEDIKDVFFYSNSFRGGISEFKTVYERRENGENLVVTFHVRNSQKGPVAYNVSVVQQG